MRAALLENPGAPLAVVDDVQIADPGPGQVRVRVSHCGDRSSHCGNVPSDWVYGQPHRDNGVSNRLHGHPDDGHSIADASANGTSVQRLSRL